MFNIHPGKGLGGKPGKRLAYGLGHRFGQPAPVPPVPPPPPLVIGGAGSAGRRRYDLPPLDEVRQDILREDQEMLDIIIESILKGIIH